MTYALLLERFVQWSAAMASLSAAYEVDPAAVLDPQSALDDLLNAEPVAVDPEMGALMDALGVSRG